MESPSLQFAAVARTIASAARAEGLVVPGFRSPPRRPGMARTVRRRSDGTATVAVAVRDRPFPAVAADLIEGVVIVNDLDEVAAGRVRTQLWSALAAEVPGLVSLPGAA